MSNCAISSIRRCRTSRRTFIIEPKYWRCFSRMRVSFVKSCLAPSPSRAPIAWMEFVSAPLNLALLIASSGKAYPDVLAALAKLGIDEATASAAGIGVYKIALLYPLEPVALLAAERPRR